jgi:hypothetical protein
MVAGGLRGFCNVDGARGAHAQGDDGLAPVEALQDEIAPVDEEPGAPRNAAGFRLC